MTTVKKRARSGFVGINHSNETVKVIMFKRNRVIRWVSYFVNPSPDVNFLMSLVSIGCRDEIGNAVTWRSSVSVPKSRDFVDTVFGFQKPEKLSVCVLGVRNGCLRHLVFNCCDKPRADA